MRTLEERASRLEGLVETLPSRMDRFEARMDNLDQKVEAMRDELSWKIDAYFRWTLGILIAGKPCS
jgi:chaperonin cofactor prefoldin